MTSASRVTPNNRFPENSMPSKSSNLLASGPLSLVGMILLAALSRLLPHPPNFSPVEAVALFGGAYFARRSTAIWVPLAAMFISDLALGLINGGSYSEYFLSAGFAPGVPVHRRIDGAGLRPARPGQRRARAWIFAARLGPVLPGHQLRRLAGLADVSADRRPALPPPMSPAFRFSRTRCSARCSIPP